MMEKKLFNGMLVDSHCHLNMLDLTPYQGKLALALEAAEANGVGYFLCIGVDLKTFPEVLHIAESYPNISASFGLHPDETADKEPSVEEIIALAKNPLIVGIGETGLDYYREHNANMQQQRFRHHIAAAKQLQKPLIIHTRAAQKDTIDILREEKASEVGGVMHCFTESWEMAKQAMDLNFYISMSGIVTFKNAVELKEVAKKVPLDRLLIETDAPYLAPVPFRGKPNEPAYVRYVAEYIAELKNTSFEIIAEKTTENFFHLFSGVGVS